MQRIVLPVVICLLLSLPADAQNVLNHITAQVGAGFSFPLGATGNHTKMGYNFVGSAGPRFNDHFSVSLDFSLHYLDVKNSLQSPVENVDLSLGSIMRMWSLTVDPEYDFIRQERFTAYA